MIVSWNLYSTGLSEIIIIIIIIIIIMNPLIIMS